MASEFKCTPNTRLRKDRELLGNYADKFQISTTNPSRVKAVTFKSSTASLNSLPGATQKVSQEKNFSAFHKKQGVKSLLDEQGRREARLETDKARQKNRRSELLMDRRKVREMTPPVDLVGNLLQDSNKNENMKANNKVESRKEQLERWRKQKLAEEASRKNRKQAPPPKVAPIKPSVPTVREVAANKKLLNAPAKKPPLASNIRSAADDGGKAGERRVTRAMIKAQTTGPSNAAMQPAIAKMKNLTLNPKTVKKPVTAAETVAKEKLGDIPGGRPVQEKDVTAKAKAALKSSSTQNLTHGAANSKLSDASTDVKKVAEVENIIVEAEMKEILPKDAIAVDSNNTDKPAAAAAAEKPRKKKMMGIDSVFVEFNQKLAAASTELMTNKKYWEERKESAATNIPEDVLGDIESALGSSKLLMESKLPQFAQLLYFYLSKEENPGPVLPCDLQGWWDVAAIQIEKVIGRFGTFSSLEKNGWIPLCPAPSSSEPPSRKPMKKSTEEGNNNDPSSKAPGQTVTSKPKKGKAQASSSLREFLAKQRQNLNPQNAEVALEAATTEPKLPETPPRSASPKEPSPVRQFEGGFFKIASPLRSSNKHLTPMSNPRVEALRGRSLKEPGSRRSSIGSNASLITLAVRKSMGTICKLGANTESSEAGSPIAAEDEADSSSWASASVRQSNDDHCEDETGATQVVRSYPILTPTRCPAGRPSFRFQSKMTRRTSLPVKVRSKCVFSRSFHHVLDMVDHRRRGKKFKKELVKISKERQKIQNPAIFAEPTSCPEITKSTVLETLDRLAKPCDEPRVELEGHSKPSTYQSLFGGNNASRPWSPFCYEQMHLFEDSQLRLELSYLYPDWIQELRVIPYEDPAWNFRRSCGSSGGRKGSFVSFSRGDTRPDPVTYCEIFGAQNSFDAHPEYSPFQDDSLEMIESLVRNHHHHQNNRSTPGPDSSPVQVHAGQICRQENNAREPIPIHSTLWDTSRDPLLPKADFPNSNSRTHSSSHDVTNQQESSIDTQDLTNEFPGVTSCPRPAANQCEVCHIFHRMQRRRRRCSDINVSAECTSCGRFTADINVTARRSLRSASGQPVPSGGVHQPIVTTE